MSSHSTDLLSAPTAGERADARLVGPVESLPAPRVAAVSPAYPAPVSPVAGADGVIGVGTLQVPADAPAATRGVAAPVSPSPEPRPAGPDTKWQSPPEWPLRKLDKVAYTMSISTGALGQVLFLGKSFGGHPMSYVGAGVIAAFAEVTMAAAGDSSLQHRTHGRKGWTLLLLLGLAVALYAAGTNASHFWAQSASMALMFGGASLIGFLLHIVNGHIEVSAYLAEQEKFTRAETEARRDAERAAEKKRRDAEQAAAAEREQAAQDEARRREVAEQREAELHQAALDKERAAAAALRTASSPAARTDRSAASRTEVIKAAINPDVVSRWATENPGASADQVRQHFLAAYGEEATPSKRTIQRWLSQAS